MEANLLRLKPTWSEGDIVLQRDDEKIIDMTCKDCKTFTIQDLGNRNCNQRELAEFSGIYQDEWLGD